jgi:HSP20 family protein
MTDKKTDDRHRKREERDPMALALPGLNLPAVFEDFMKPFDELIGPLFPRSMRPLWTELRGRESDVDVQDRGDHFVVTAELPGFEKNDVEVKVGSDSLELKAEKRFRASTDKWEQSSHSYFHRYVGLPEQVLSEKVDGTMNNGVLELKLPKKEPKPGDKPRRVSLK